jgi:hypothetical protein
MEITGTDDYVLVCFGFWRIRKAALHYKIPQHLRQKGRGRELHTVRSRERVALSLF